MVQRWRGQERDVLWGKKEDGGWLGEKTWTGTPWDTCDGKKQIRCGARVGGPNGTGKAKRRGAKTWCGHNEIGQGA